MKPTPEMIERFEKAVRANGYRTCDDTTEKEYHAAKDALTAALSASPAGVVKPKPLEWEKHPADGSVLSDGHTGRIYVSRAMTPFGAYFILTDGKSFFVEHSRFGDTIATCESEEAAKSAAFADYSARIMSAIEPAGMTMTMQPLGDEFQAAIGDLEGLYEPDGAEVETAAQPNFPGATDAYMRLITLFDQDATAASFLSEDGDGGFVGGIYRMAREIERLRVALKGDEQ